MSGRKDLKAWQKNAQELMRKIMRPRYVMVPLPVRARACICARGARVRARVCVVQDPYACIHAYMHVHVRVCCMCACMHVCRYACTRACLLATCSLAVEHASLRG